ncbi:MAG: hypothetical protein AAFW81_01555 [Pseudomonadota bacterium]
MKQSLPVGLLGALLITGCTHDVAVQHQFPAPVRADVGQREQVAKTTCEAQYKADHQNFLSAIQNVIAKNGQHPDLKLAPLDQFRAEINAAYNAVVMRCKTHTHCLEVHGYEEAKCYMAASDRKDAERRFSDLSERLREIAGEAEAEIAKAKKKKGTRVTVQTTVKQSNKQKNKTHVGDNIEDQDVLILCGDADKLLDRRCRKPCKDKGC